MARQTRTQHQLWFAKTRSGRLRLRQFFDVWEEEVTFVARRGDIEAAPGYVELLDEDKVSQDDFLGAAELDLYT